MTNTVFKMVAVVLALCCVLNLSAMAAETLQYSELVSIPSNYRSFNCYGYAIGTNENVDPGYYVGPTLSYADRADETVIKNNVIADLVALGYSNVRSVSSSYVLKPGEFMVAFACGYWWQIGELRPMMSNDAYLPLDLGNDYHFWRLNVAGGYWYHKMGTSSAIMCLKYGYTPENITVNSK